MSTSSLSFTSTQSFRNVLMAKNLKPYNVPGEFSPVVGQLNYAANINDFNVVDTPVNPQDKITSGYYSNQAYVLNEFGPTGGFGTSISYNGPLTPNAPNQGEYTNINETRLDLVNQLNIDAAYSENVYGPDGGFGGLITITDIQVNSKIFQPYWEPPSFAPSSYAPYDILFQDNPAGTNGPLSDDSFIAKLGAQRLKYSLEERIGVQTLLQSLSSNPVNLLSSPYEASLVAGGQQPVTGKNYKITVPENITSQNDSLESRIEGTYVPLSPIPGDYFEENTFGGKATNQTSTALSVFNQATGGALGPILNLRRNPSQIFLANTGSGQRFALFNNISQSRYQPGYDKSLGGLNRLVEGVAQNALELLGLSEDRGGYYVGSVNAEPAQISSPPNQIPIDPFGRQIQAMVYGPSELGQLYEGNIEKIQFGLAAKPTIEGGGIAGSFVWTSPKQKGAAGRKATIGGGIGRQDDEYRLISSDYTKNESTTFSFKKTSILDQTQRLTQSADLVTGKQKLKHVGTAINQVSKVFNDGYKEITKGSRVIYYYDNVTGENTISRDGQEVGVEYCRLFTKDTPYYTYADLQKSDGITTKGRRFTYSVLDNAYNLNIAPIKGPDSTNIVRGFGDKRSVKKYMLSIENLAWRTSSKEGYTYDDLPDCERGPNGGRIMWFPPYDVKFNDTTQTTWQETDFLGRPEPIYTYKNTKRTGSLSFSIVVDSPSVLNLLVDEQLKRLDNQKIDSILHSFFAGCVKYDLYTLAKKYNTFRSSELQILQQEISKVQKTPDELLKIIKSIPYNGLVENKKGAPIADNPPKNQKDEATANFEKDYSEYAFYFEDAVPASNGQNFEKLIAKYASPENKTKYSNKALALFDDSGPVDTFFSDYIEGNWNKIKDTFVSELKGFLDKGATVQIAMVGSASAVGSTDSNLALSKRRIDSVKTYLSEKGLKNYLDSKKLDIIDETGEGESSVVPKTNDAKGEKIVCSEIAKDKDGQTTGGSKVYSVQAMACRRVKIKSVTVIQAPEVPSDKKETAEDKAKTTETKTEPTTPNNPNPTIPVSAPEPTVSVVQKLKDGIGKRILRKLLSECNYFDLIKEKTPFIYDSLREKIKYFNPAFHSMTPEGLNARLTFLNQCMRPGETIPIIDPDGKPIYNDALNTSFGTPPILVIRVGDFYHSKAVCDSVAITYDPLIYDMNPEGIGVQPMIAKVTMNIKFIGGHGLAKPVEQLQNALSFNYYANTEIYDERAVFTEDTSELDREIFDSIVEGEKSATKNDAVPQPARKGGKTIGDIATTVKVEGGETGTTTFQKIMTSTNSITKEYFSTLVNTVEKFIKQNNYGMWYLVSNKTNYAIGNFKLYNSADVESPIDFKMKIFGAPNKADKRIEDLLNATKKDIETGTSNYIIEKMSGYQPFKPADINILRLNLIDFLTLKVQDSVSGIFEEIQTITTFQQDMVQNFSKLNVVNTLTDGKILESGKPFVYTLTPTKEINESKDPEPDTAVTNTIEEIASDYFDIGVKFAEYDEFLRSDKPTGYPILPSGDKFYTSEGENIGDFPSLYDKLSKVQDKRMYILLSQIFTNKDKLLEMRTALLNNGLNKVPKFEDKLRKVLNDFADIAKEEFSREKSLINDLKKDSKFRNFTKKDIYNPNKTRKFEYTTVIDDDRISLQEELVENVWSDVNVDDDTETWNDKVEFKIE